MIVFTITNTLTDQVYVGTTRDTIDTRWQQILQATESGLEAGLYTDIRKHGAENFDIAEWAEAEDLQELRDLTQDAIETYSAISLQGMRTKEPVPQLNKLKSIASKRTSSSTVASSSASTAAGAAASILASRTTSAAEQKTANHCAVSISNDEKQTLPTGRVSSAAQEKKIREAIEAEKDAMQLKRNAKEKAAAAEMALLMARIDARGKKPKKTTNSSSTGRTTTTTTTSSSTLASKVRASGKTANSTESASDTLKLSSGRVSSSAKEKQIREAIAQEKDARLEEKIAKQKAEATEMAMIMARIDARKAPKKAKAAAAANPSKSTIIKKRPVVTDAPKPLVKIASSRTQLKTSSVKTLTEKPKLGTGRLSSSAREKKIREAIANEKAARQAEKQSQQVSQADEMAAIMARLDARAKTVKRR